MFVLILLCPLFISCGDREDMIDSLTFVGDSKIARWDMQTYFSSFITRNEGIGGVGIDYIENLSGKFKGETIVVNIGENDNHIFQDSAKLLRYTQRYENAILNLEAERVYLFELQPHCIKNESPAVNEGIQRFNAIISEWVKSQSSIEYMQVYDSFLDEKGNPGAAYFTDGIHLSASGYEILTDALYNALDPNL